MELDERVLSSAAKGRQLALLLSLWGRLKDTLKLGEKLVLEVSL